MNPRRLVLGVVLALCLGCGPSSSSRPNILLVVTDDQGNWTCGPEGSAEIETPTMDRLAATGVWFVNASSPSPVCSPARASLLTGRLPSQHGIHDFLSETGDDERDWLAGEVLLPELLREAGYFTSLVGKWHLSGGGRPRAGVFDRWLSYDVAAEGWRNQYLHHGPVHLLDNGTPLTVDGFQTAELTRSAIEIIAHRPGDRPFFMLFAPTETHAPFEGHPEAWVDRYRRASFDGIPRGESSPLPPSGPASVMPDDPTEMLAQYFAAVSAQDAWIGELLTALEGAGILDDTLVIVTSDHGHMNGHHGLVGKANATLPQNLYDEVVRVPLVVSWAGHLPRGVTSELFVDHLDLFATVLDAARVTLDAETSQRILSPGRSLLLPFDGSALDWRHYRFAEHGNARMVADRRWKLVRRYEPLDPRFGDELYDLETDPRETSNLIDVPGYEYRRVKLEAVLDDHFARYEDPARSGTRIMEQPPCNGREPWTRLAAGLSEPE